MYRIFILSLALLTLFSCSTTKQYITILKPAEITVDKDIKSLVVLNRTLPSSEVGNAVEGFLTGEMPQQDRKAAVQALQGFYDRTQDVKRFEVIMAAEPMIGSGSGVMFPNPLSWNDVEKLCNQHKTDALLSLETFDSNVQYNTVTDFKNVKNAAGIPIKMPYFKVTVRVTVTLGFRLYYPKIRSIYDQDQYSFWRSWTREGNTVAAAMNAFMAKEQLILNTAYFSGENYAKKINPYYLNVRRLYYKRGASDPNLKLGSRMARVQAWDDAERYWNQAYESPKRKAKARAAYNLALIREMEGKLPLAKELSDKAYGLGARKALDYSRILNQRIRDQQRLNEQMGQ